MIELISTTDWYEVHLRRPEVRNALSSRGWKQLSEIWRNIEQAPKRLVILKGEGPFFCAGADLEEMKASLHWTQEQNLKQSQEIYSAFKSMFECPCPILTVVRGGAFGGGLGLVALSDWVIAEEGTQFAFSEVRLGIAPSIISDFILRKFTLGQMMPWMVGGFSFGVSEAIRLGLVHEVTPEAFLDQSIKKRTEAFLQAGPQAARKTKALLKDLTMTSSADERQTKVTNLIAELRSSPEGQEGLSSFLEKRKPNWVQQKGE